MRRTSLACSQTNTHTRQTRNLAKTLTSVHGRHGKRKLTGRLARADRALTFIVAKSARQESNFYRAGGGWMQQQQEPVETTTGGLAPLASRSRASHYRSPPNPFPSFSHLPPRPFTRLEQLLRRRLGGSTRREETAATAGKITRSRNAAPAAKNKRIKGQSKRKRKKKRAVSSTNSAVPS